MTASREAELKSQGALEASRDPDSSVTAKEAEDTAVEEAKKSGSAAMQFDPDATPAQKAAQARSVRLSCLCYATYKILTRYKACTSGLSPRAEQECDRSRL
jgi:hypothetical protein